MSNLANTGNKLPKRRTSLVVTIVLLLIVSSVLAFLQYNTILTDNAHATATADTHATGIAFADTHATATAQIQATSDAATAQAQATAMAWAQATAAVIAANPDPYPPAGTLAFVDPLSQPKAWSSGSNTNGGKCKFVNGAYQISQSQPNMFFHCNNKNVQYSDFAFEVKMTITQGDCGGVMIRNDVSAGKDYNFRVCQNGYYYFFKYASKSASDSTALTSGNSSAINQGTGQANTIAIVANGSNFDLYVNGQKIDSAGDSDYSQGTVDFLAWDRGNVTTVTYQDARLWTI
jgi:hypothetical protein